MTVLRETEQTCRVCGHRERYTVALSGSAFGSADLDTRPPPFLRFNLAFEIQRCPACGYCAPDVSEGPDEAAAVVAREDYRAQLDDPSRPPLANAFLCWSQIQEAAGAYAEAGWAALKAAWACDDEGAEEAARRCRTRALALFRRARAQGQPFAEDPASEAALEADLLRRCRRFDEARAAAEAGLRAEPTPLLAAVLRYQLRLCDEGDDGLHQVEEALPEEA